MADLSEEIDDSLLIRAPCWVFMLVAASDGHVDRKEQNKLQRLLGHTEGFDTRWMRSALQGAQQNLDTILEELTQQPQRAGSELERIRDLAEATLPQDEAREFKHDLLAFGKSIAEASGGVLGFGNKIDPDEAEMIRRLTKLLRFEPSAS